MKKRNKNKCISKIIEKSNIPIIDLDILDGEIWKPLSTLLYEEIKPIYYISNKNRVFSSINNKLLKVKCKDKSNDSCYYTVSLQCNIDGKSKSKKFLMHRLMMSVFNPVKNMDILDINHKDGNKHNNELENLEWVTPKENAIHARDNNLLNPSHGEEHVCATLSNEDVIKICKLLTERKYTQIEISKMMNTTESIVNSIAQRKAWKDISKNFDFSLIQQRIPKNFTFKQIHEICKYFEKHKKDDNMSIRKHCKNALIYIGFDNSKITESNLNSIRLLYNRERYTFISDKYNF